MIIYSTKEIIFTSIISKYSQSNADIKHIWDKIKHQFNQNIVSFSGLSILGCHLVFCNVSIAYIGMLYTFLFSCFTSMGVTL
jgi:hypothetical protein